ncbi:MerR family transcriptional regulator [Parafrankia discariae]|uniref:MerR family transcriptional regulator n=1 Tax=Parafrankia discariae TaxID=365528 RepID=UPI0003715CB7|nr:MerR family transcriptional regulator [Parafrankia discariae]
MRIGELARRAGTSPRALRHYEDQGLLAARRLTNGYRDYSDADLRAVEEIRALLAAGFALEETRPFVECLRAGNETADSCPDSIEGYRRKIAQIDDYVARLLRSRERLAAQLALARDVTEAPVAGPSGVGPSGAGPPGAGPTDGPALPRVPPGIPGCSLHPPRPPGRAHPQP